MGKIKYNRQVEQMNNNHLSFHTLHYKLFIRVIFTMFSTDLTIIKYGILA
jgi:hypothetical protein